MSTTTIDVTYNTTQNTYTFSNGSGNATENIGSGTQTIDLVLISAAAGDEFAGIKIARDQDDLAGLTGELDTGSNFYPGTCFKVSCHDYGSHTNRLLRLEDIDRPGVDDSGDWYYALGIKHSDGTESWPDPKIHNLGGEGIKLPPGLYFAGNTGGSRKS